MSGQEIGYVGFSPDYKSKKEHTLIGEIEAERQREENRIRQEGYRAGIEAMRDAFKRHFKLGILEENDVDLIADKLLEHKEGE